MRGQALLKGGSVHVPSRPMRSGGVGCHRCHEYHYLSDKSRRFTSLYFVDSVPNFNAAVPRVFNLESRIR